MQRIVNNGLKIDLHIHSCESSHKDGKKVKNNTLSNITMLIQKLDEQGVNICAITDHDTFSYAMYQGSKAHFGENGKLCSHRHGAQGECLQAS